MAYASEADMEPALQQDLLAAIHRELEQGPVSVLFVVDTTQVPASVPKFWLEVAKQLAPRFCAMAVLSDSLVVRTVASGFSVSNRLRGQKLEVRPWGRTELDLAERWCGNLRAKAAAAAPGR